MSKDNAWVALQAVSRYGLLDINMIRNSTGESKTYYKFSTLELLLYYFLNCLRWFYQLGDWREWR